MAGPLANDPYGFVPITRGGRIQYYLARGPGGPVATIQAYQGARAGVEREVAPLRAAGVNIPPAQVEARVFERLGGYRQAALSPDQYAYRNRPVFYPQFDRQHPEWAIAITSDPNQVAEWIKYLATGRGDAEVWVAGYGLAKSTSGEFEVNTGKQWATLGDPSWSIQEARDARRPDRLKIMLDPDAGTQFWTIEEYTLRWHYPGR